MWVFQVSDSATLPELVDKPSGINNSFGQVPGTSDASKTQSMLTRSYAARRAYTQGTLHYAVGIPDMNATPCGSKK
jgi:hypothetical protein